jgi:hypothetical protein
VEVYHRPNGWLQWDHDQATSSHRCRQGTTCRRNICAILVDAAFAWHNCLESVGPQVSITSLFFSHSHTHSLQRRKYALPPNKVSMTWHRILRQCRTSPRNYLFESMHGNYSQGLSSPIICILCRERMSLFPHIECSKIYFNA